MWNNLFDRMLRHLIRSGDLYLTLPDGSTHRYGDGSGNPVKIHINSSDLPGKIVRNPELAVGEAYMDGDLTIDGDDLRGFLALAIKNIGYKDAFIWWQKPQTTFRNAFRRIQQFNPAGRAQANVAHHYDLSGALYELFLDRDKQYSCGYFRTGNDTLEQAQINKKDHIARKLMLEPGQHVLDIGCGWGGMALTLARDYGVRVTGVTLSREQLAVATQRARQAGLGDQVDFRLQDYRQVDDTFDRIVSVGMFEHVGVPHYREYFGHVKRMLNPDGVALIHSIGRLTPPGSTSPWITKYIFPGGYVPSMSETMAAIEKESICTDDVEVWRLHYAMTLRHWHDRFMANIDKARQIYDDRFCRMWRYYLIASELSFVYGGQVVFQFQLSHDQRAVPLTRDYLYTSQKAGGLRHAAE